MSFLKKKIAIPVIFGGEEFKPWTYKLYLQNRNADYASVNIKKYILLRESHAYIIYSTNNLATR